MNSQASATKSNLPLAVSIESVGEILGERRPSKVVNVLAIGQSEHTSSDALVEQLVSVSNTLCDLRVFPVWKRRFERAPTSEGG